LAAQVHAFDFPIEADFSRESSLANCPVDQPTKFELVITLTRARALGLTILQSVLARVDDLVE